MQNILIIGLGGALAQWAAWYFRFPSIVVLLVFGLLLGPVFGFINPKEVFGENYTNLIGFSVALILFEGGLSLRFKEITKTFSDLWRISLVGGLLFFAILLFITLYFQVLPIYAGLIFSAVMIVTGPTVIIPLLRQARINRKISTLLKWEGIINDPFGALLAVLVFEGFLIFKHSSPEELLGFTLSFLFAIIIAGLVFGYFCGQLIAYFFRKSWVPEYLKSPLLLMMVITCFTLANSLQDEAGLLAVTLMGIAMANSKLPAYEDIRHFKENISVILISSLFLMLAGSLDLKLLLSINFKYFAYILVIIFLIRPIAIFIATMGTKLSLKEKLYIGLVAPRGIVAIAVCGLFSQELLNDGLEGGNELLLMAYLLVIFTVIIFGFSAKYLASLLGLSRTNKTGLLLIGANAFSVGLAKILQTNEINTLISDANYTALKAARLSGIDIYYGEIISEHAELNVDFLSYNKIISLRGNDAYNSLICRNLAPKIGRDKLYQLNNISVNKGDVSQEKESKNIITMYGKAFLPNNISLDQLLLKIYKGYKFTSSKVTDQHTGDDFYARMHKDALVIIVLRKKQIIIPLASEEIPLEIDDKIIYFQPSENENDER